MQNGMLGESAEKISIKTNSLTAAVNLHTGAVSFFDNNGKPILKEKQINGRSLDAAVFEGEPSSHIRQTFETTSDDAYYGLGQHQNDVFNYKGQQVFFFQNNTEVAIPFLISQTITVFFGTIILYRGSVMQDHISRSHL